MRPLKPLAPVKRGEVLLASEVKALAGETAKATTEISSKITAIQASTSDAVQAIGGISQTIRQIDDAASSIAAAVEQQGAATLSIVNSVSEASRGTTEVTVNMGEVSRNAEVTGAGAKQVLSASSELSQQADRMRADVQAFLKSVRAA